MAFTDINSEDRLVQKTVADYLHDKLGWESFYAWNDEIFHFKSKASAPPATCSCRRLMNGELAV
jgi:hypothetical protein